MLVVFDCSSESVICKYSFVLRRSGSFEEKNFSDDSSDWHSESASDRISEYEGLSDRRAHSSFSEHLDKVSHEIRLVRVQPEVGIILCRGLRELEGSSKS